MKPSIGVFGEVSRTHLEGEGIDGRTRHAGRLPECGVIRREFQDRPLVAGLPVRTLTAR